MRTHVIVDFAVPTDHRVELKEYKKKKYMHLTMELKKLWNMKVKIIPIVILATVTKELGPGLEDSEMTGE